MPSQRGLMGVEEKNVQISQIGNYNFTTNNVNVNFNSLKF